MVDGSEATPTVATTGVVDESAKPVSSLELGAAETMPAARGETNLAGARIGRFTVERLLGRGGMGEVYAAHDPELDRMVAIKLLRPEVSTSRADARLRQEARAMAKLSHANLVTVHDVGVHDGQLFVAMELVRGGTLRAWQVGRSWREIVSAYVMAGRGLAAAHRAGLVHRDFKPDNVLVGDHGRVAVGDFGLARSAGDDAAEGALAGTVRYMAPEQLERRTADERSDQFAFCVALWEALDRDPFGPFDGGEDTAKAVIARRATISAGPPKKLPGVPVRVTKALLRGMAIDPAQRWPSMTALVDHLDPARRRSLIALGVVAVGAAAVAVGATWLAREPAADPCANAAAPMQDVWKPDTAQRIRDAFAATNKSYAADAATHTISVLDERAAAWRVMRVETCRASARGTQAAELGRKRERCLDARLSEQGALVGVLTHAPAVEIVDAALHAANGLPAIESCAQVTALLEQAPEPAVVAQLQQDVARADTLEKVGDPDIVKRLPELRARALALDWAPALARIDSTIGHEAWRRGDAEGAIEPLREGARAAARAKDDALGARILAIEVQALVDLDRPADAIEVAHSGELLAARAGDPPELRAHVLESLAAAYQAESKFDDADHAYAAATKLREQVGDRYDLGATLISWANMLREQSLIDRAAPLCARGADLLRAELGDHDPDYARALQSCGNISVDAHRYADARTQLEASLAIKEAAFGADSPTVAMTVHSLGNVAEVTDDREHARELYTRASAVFEKAYGHDSWQSQMARYSLGQNLCHLHRIDEGVAMLREVLAQREAAKIPQPEKVANSHDAIAECYELAKRYREAIAEEQLALAIRRKVLGEGAQDVADSKAKLAELAAQLTK